MDLRPGAKLGSYEIVSAIGKGGMGEVWKARDPQLGRDVAIKVSAQQFTDRFEREARAIAALNHGNVCTLYHIGPNYLVMEYIEGPTLAERIQEGAIPLEEALGIAKQIADALEAAHEKGIVHRDLKPANVKIRPDGSVKVLDFGLAKAGDAQEVTADSPTMMPGTQMGMILGTAGYMSPEQARGKVVDKRADIWAFGVVLYEMVTGKRLFQGEDLTETLASVVKDKPDLSGVPAQVRLLLARCLEKDPKRRLRDIGDWELLLVTDTNAPSLAKARVRSRLSRAGWEGRVGWVAAGVFALVAGWLAFVHFREKPPAGRSIRFEVSSPEKVRFTGFQLSPDGRQMALVGVGPGQARLWVRSFDSVTARPLAGTEGATYPFWSPDSTQIAFFAQGKLRKIPAAGGTALTICDAQGGRGGTWNRDGVIVFTPALEGGLYRVPDEGGSPTPLTKPTGAGSNDRFPEFLPDGRHFLFLRIASRTASGNQTGIYAGAVDGSVPVRILGDESEAQYTPGYLVFRREDTLMAQPFDPKRLRTTGAVQALAEQVDEAGNTGFGAFAASAEGTVAWRSGLSRGTSQLVWLDRAGKRLGEVTKPAAILAPALSPDGKVVAYSIPGSNRDDIWLQDVGRGILSRFTFGLQDNTMPVWSPDGRRILYGSATGTASWELYLKPSSGEGNPELALKGLNSTRPSDWSADGKFVVYSDRSGKTNDDLWLLPMEGDRKPVLYLQTASNENNARFSPDGKWMAYQSDESGHYEVYVQHVLLNGSKFQISSGGGVLPRWRRDGQELFFIASDGKLMAVPVKIGTAFEPGTAHALFESAQFANAVYFQPSPDGQRFLALLQAGGDVEVPITVVTNWPAGLKK